MADVSLTSTEEVIQLTSVSGASTADITSAVNAHSALATGVHGVGASTVASASDVSAAVTAHNALATAHGQTASVWAGLAAAVNPPIGTVVCARSNPDPAKYLEMTGYWVLRSAWPALSAITPNHQPEAPWLKATSTGLPTSGASYRQAVSNGSVVVMLRDSSALCYTSANGIDWTAQNMPVSTNWQSVAWNGSVFCAISVAAGTIAATSPDGVTWTPQVLPVSTTWYNIVWNGSVFCAIGAAGVATSPDGATWTTGTLPDLTPQWITIAWNGSYFVALGYITGNSLARAKSVDGINWTDYGVISDLVTSLQQKAPMVWTGSNFTAWTPYGTMFSEDGLTWSWVYSMAGDTSVSPSVYDPTSGYHYITAGSSTRYGYLSREGRRWFKVAISSASNAVANGCVYAFGRFFAINTDGVIYYSQVDANRIFIRQIGIPSVGEDFGGMSFLKAAI